jgi:abhydrolase domain-containing protein 13
MYHQIGCNILLMDYRGYGMSQGSPSEEGLYLDAQAALHYLTSRKDVNHNEIVVFGRSLGKNANICVG